MVGFPIKITIWGSGGHHGHGSPRLGLWEPLAPIKPLSARRPAVKAVTQPPDNKEPPGVGHRGAHRGPPGWTPWGTMGSVMSYVGHGYHEQLVIDDEEVDLALREDGIIRNRF